MCAYGVCASVWVRVMAFARVRMCVSAYERALVGVRVHIIKINATGR